MIELRIFFFQFMPLLWTFTEGLVLVALRWGFLSLTKEEGHQKIFIFFCLTTFLLLIILRFWGAHLFDQFVDLRKMKNLILFRRASWNFFCTLWVILEGIIMIYVLKIYRLIKPLLGNKQSNNTKRAWPRKETAYGIPALIISLFALYAFYQYHVLMLGVYHPLSIEEIRLLSSFYIRICGLFWILFEGIVAITGIRMLLCLKRMETPV